jgi:NO-binding membrane sensor protein with MHYT domain
MEFSYDPVLIALSLAIAILGSFTGLVMTAGIERFQGPEAVLRIFLGSVGIGGGIWAMHFIAMLAVILPTELRFDMVQTILSAVIVVAFTGIAFAIVGRKLFGRMSLLVGAVVLGLGIGGMHYLGMTAVRGNCVVVFSRLGVLISIIIAMQASAVALWFAFRERGLVDTCIGAIALGLAVASMHYTAMEGTRFLPSEATEYFANAFTARYLAISISIAVYGICGVCIFVFAALTFARRSTSRGSRGVTS